MATMLTKLCPGVLMVACSLACAQSSNPITLQVENTQEFNDSSEGFENLGGKFTEGETKLNENLNDRKNYLKEWQEKLISEEDKSKTKRKDLAKALINFKALNQMKIYQQKMELLYEINPGFNLISEFIPKLDKYSNGDESTNDRTRTVVSAVVLRNALELTQNAKDIKDEFQKAVTDKLKKFNEEQAAIKAKAESSGGLTQDESLRRKASLETLQNELLDLINNQAEETLEIPGKATKFYARGDIDAIKEIDPGRIFSTSKNISVPLAVKNIGINTDPFPVRSPDIQEKLGVGVQLLNETDKGVLANKVMDLAYISMSNYALGQIVARRMGDDSVIDTIKRQAVARYSNPNWHKEIAVASKAALLREIAVILAYDQWITYQYYLLEDQKVGLYASMNAGFAKLTSLALEFLRVFRISTGKLKQFADTDWSDTSEEIDKKLEDEVDEHSDIIDSDDPDDTFSADELKSIREDIKGD